MRVIFHSSKKLRLNGVATLIGTVGLSVAAFFLVVLMVRFFTGHTKIPDGSVQFVKGHISVKDAIDGAVKILTGAVCIHIKDLDLVILVTNQHVNYKYVTIVVVDIPEGLPLAVTLTSSSSWLSSVQFVKGHTSVKDAIDGAVKILTVAYLSDILMANSGIQKLQLNSTGISDEGFAGLAGALHENNSIRSIHLNGNYGGALGVASLGKGIEGNKSLRELHLHGNNMGNEGVRALVSGLSAHKGKITLLDLGNNDIGPKGAFHVANYIKKTKSLLWLNLYMNDIGDEGAETIADALKQNRMITTIDLGGNNIHASGVSEIAQVLKDNSIITTTNSFSLFLLELVYNPIGPDGAKALYEIIKFHGKLETLKTWLVPVSHHFITFQIGAKGVEYVADALKYNPTLSTLDFAGKWVGR
ncbi:hypothetical protein IEQ34_009074 [Dendrobium chrysotoxum]|uniref:Uncharacterized protein n=1 Tax=Dendrobium chrysotoxum TaxID=161865 RepID=A0AAV7H0D4_DENCH|nr:hypothetical protein IEQ34_009074 [Dendrobium chrysotoxum]